MPLPWARLALILLLGASLSLKVWHGVAANQPHGQPTAIPLFESLEEDGFTLAEQGWLESPVWVASKDDCRIVVTTVSPLGWHQSAMAAHKGQQALGYVYDGRIYQDQPVLLTRLGYYWHKLANHFYSTAQPPVFAVVTSRGCAAQSIDTASLAHFLS
jgi:hypothetical protein